MRWCFLICVVCICDETKEDGMGGEMGYLQRMPAIGWIGCYPLTWHGCTDVRLRMWEVENFSNEDWFCNSDCVI